MASSKSFKTILIGIVAVIVVAASGFWYMSSLQETLWKQSVDEVLEITDQGAHAFGIYVRKDQTMISGLAESISELDSTDSQAMIKEMKQFGGSTINFITALPNEHIMYSNQSDKAVTMRPSARELFDTVGREGTIEPRNDPFTGQPIVGYYQRFTFANGEPGVLVKVTRSAQVADEFSLSFYNDQGFSYVVDPQGKVMVHSRYAEANHAFGDVFETLDQEANNPASIEKLRSDLSEGKKGTMLLNFDGSEHLFAYAPISGTENWSMLTLIPASVISAHTNSVLGMTQVFIFMVVVGLLAILALFWITYQNSRRMHAKDREINFRDALFSELAKNTDEAFLMVNPRNFEFDYVSDNLERLTGLTIRDFYKDSNALQKHTVSNGSHRPLSLGDLAATIVGAPKETEFAMDHAKTGEYCWFFERSYRTKVDGEERIIVMLSDRTRDRRHKEMLEQALSSAK